MNQFYLGADSCAASKSLSPIQAAFDQVELFAATHDLLDGLRDSDGVAFTR